MLIKNNPKQIKNQYIQIRVNEDQKKEIDKFFGKSRKKSEIIRGLIFDYIEDNVKGKL